MQYLGRMATPRYHVHIDAAHMPLAFTEKAVSHHGLKFDNFDHSFVINGITHAGTHFTKYVYDEETSSEDIREKCEELSAHARETDFVGLIQCEFIVEELEWNGQEVSTNTVHAPFKVTKRALDLAKGERFKKHELHLEIKKNPPATAIISALLDTGMDMLEGVSDVTFTCNGNPKELMVIKKALKTFLNDNKEHFTGKLTYEATAFWSLHNMEIESLPLIIDSVQLLQ